jgi:hypothetical protein
LRFKRPGVVRHANNLGARSLQRYFNRSPTGSSKKKDFSFHSAESQNFLSVNQNLRTELLQANQIWLMLCSGFAIFYLRSLKIREHKQNFIASGHFIDHLFHVTKEPYLFLLLTVCAKRFKKFVFRAMFDTTQTHDTHCHALANRFTSYVGGFVLVKECPTSKVLVTLAAWNLLPEKDHGGTDVQSLHVCSHLNVSPVWQSL